MKYGYNANAASSSYTGGTANQSKYYDDEPDSEILRYGTSNTFQDESSSQIQQPPSKVGFGSSVSRLSPSKRSTETRNGRGAIYTNAGKYS